MHAIYNKRRNGSTAQYEFVKEASLAGCNKGWIPYFLQQQVANMKQKSEPLRWHVNNAEIQMQLENDEEKPSGNALIIDLKPNSKEYLSLFEILDIWGVSAKGWTPLMLHLRGLFIDADPRKFNRNRFTLSAKEMAEPIFSMLYMRGTIINGKLEGTWNFPRRSSTNSVLLWPDTLKYFSAEANKIMDRSTTEADESK